MRSNLQVSCIPATRHWQPILLQGLITEAADELIVKPADGIGSRKPSFQVICRHQKNDACASRPH
jgi:hypothetical protein